MNRPETSTRKTQGNSSSFYGDLNENEGVSILLVTHDASIASYSKKLLYIKDGKIVVTLDKGEMSQSDYFQKIIDLNLQETII
ncbi:MAG: hypothetical protein IJM15_02425 [Erysipelotrichaceae bacterium]|nr:hypothetical protein [Erysipelotrichaceae bacterium]